MKLTSLDYTIIIAFFVVSTLLGIIASRRAGKSFSEYFLAGGKMPWWMLGLSMVLSPDRISHGFRLRSFMET